jgi:hypothetical protein
MEAGDEGQEEPAGKPERERLLPRLAHAATAPDSYGLVLVLIFITYAVSVALTAHWAATLVLAVQIATVWVALRASRARRQVRRFTDVVLVLAAVTAVVVLIAPTSERGDGFLSIASGILYFVAPFSIVRHLVLRRVIDLETVLGAIAAYLLAGMFFAFLYRAVGQLQHAPFFGPQGHGTLSQDLFFSFTTLTTTGYGNLVPSGNPGQTMAVTEMLVGQLFLVTAVGKVISSWDPRAHGRGALRD